MYLFYSLYYIHFFFLLSSPRAYRKLLLCSHYLHNVQMLMCVIMFNFMHEITCQINGGLCISLMFNEHYIDT